MYKILSKVLLFEHLRVLCRLCNLATIGGHMFRGSGSGNCITNCNINGSCYWNANAVGMYIHFPTHLCELCGSPRAVHSAIAIAYTNCIQLETIFYYTDLM